MSDQSPEVTESASVDRVEPPEGVEAQEKSLTCAFCGASTDVDVPESYAFDLKWVCPCGGTNVLEGQGPAGVPEELRAQTPHLQATPPSEDQPAPDEG